MRLTNYWWSLIWVFIAGIVLLAVFPQNRESVNGKLEMRWHILPAFILVLPYIIWAGFRADDYGDTYAYRRMFREAPSSFSEIGSYIQESTKDQGFSAFMAIFKSIFGSSEVFFFLFVALIQLLCIVYLFRKYSCNYWLSIYIFVAAGEYISWMHNGMRQFLAVCITLVALDFLVRKKYFAMIVLILLASTIHASALLMIPGVLIMQGKAWNKKTILALIAAMIAILMIDRFTNILETLLVDTQYSEAFTEVMQMGDDGTNPIRVIVYAMPLFLSIIGWKWIRQEEDPMINLAVNSGLCALGVFGISVFSSGLLLGRLPVFFYMISQGILLPWIIDNIFTDRSKRVVLGAVVICYVGYFYYQMHYGMGLL